MDQESLVANHFDAGRDLRAGFLAEGIDVTAVIWARSSEDGKWTLYLVSRDIESKGRVALRGIASDILFKVKNNDMAGASLALIAPTDKLNIELFQPAIDEKRWVGRRFRPRFHYQFDELYIYPPVPHPTATPASRTRVLGVNGSASEDIADEIGTIDAAIGAADFHPKLVELLTARYGDIERFHAAGPRLLLVPVH